MVIWVNKWLNWNFELFIIYKLVINFTVNNFLPCTSKIVNSKKSFSTVLAFLFFVFLRLSLFRHFFLNRLLFLTFYISHQVFGHQKWIFIDIGGLYCIFIMCFTCRTSSVGEHILLITIRILFMFVQFSKSFNLCFLRLLFNACRVSGLILRVERDDLLVEGGG